MKTRTQAIGTKQHSHQKVNFEKKDKENSRKAQKQHKDVLDSNTKNIMIALQDQVKQLKHLIMEMINNAEIDEEKKN